MNSTYAAEADIPAALKEHYKEQDGKWVLFLDGDHPAVTAVVTEANKKVGEFRNNTLAKDKALTDALAKLDLFKDISPENHAAALAKVTELEGKQKGMKNQDELQALISAAVKPLSDALATERTARETAQKDANVQKTDGALTAAGLKAGVSEGAISDFLFRGRSAFALVDGRLQAQKDGQPVYSTKRPGEFLNVDEWASDLQAEAPHLYKPSEGGGAGGGNAPGSNATPTIPRSEMKHHLEDVASGKVKIGQ